MITGANVATIVVMLLVGYSDHLHPVSHPLLSTMGMTFPFFLVANLLFLVFWLLFKWSRAWVPVVGFVLAYVPISIYVPLNVKDDAPEDAIKLVSYNVCGYGGNYKYENGVEKVVGYMRELNPDIICIQEAGETKHKNMMAEYAKTWAYNDTAVVCNNAKSKNALGIHTRYPIIKRERIDYPEPSANGSVAWWLKVGSDTLIVVNNHFESCHLTAADREQYKQLLKGEVRRDSVRAESKLLLVKLAEANAKRAPQIDRVCRFVREHPEHPVIVCGDFNDNPVSYSRYAMSKLLTDCFVATGRGVGLTYNRKGFNFRIDHVFCSSDIEPFGCYVDSEMDASDHYPVVCQLKISGKP